MKNISSDKTLVLLPGRLAVCRLPADSQYPQWAKSEELLSITRTSDELSVVCDERNVHKDVRAERGWRALKIQGPLDFSMVAVLAAIAAILAKAGVSIFAISTYDTDYILVKEVALEQAMQVLTRSGYEILNNDNLPA